jgi:hypothetical protein
METARTTYACPECSTPAVTSSHTEEGHITNLTFARERLSSVGSVRSSAIAHPAETPMRMHLAKPLLRDASMPRLGLVAATSEPPQTTKESGFGKQSLELLDSG